MYYTYVIYTRVFYVYIDVYARDPFLRTKTWFGVDEIDSLAGKGTYCQTGDLSLVPGTYVVGESKLAHVI